MLYEKKTRRRVPFTSVDISSLEIKRVQRVLKSGWITTGKEVELFSQNIRSYLHTDYAVPISSATAGLYLALAFYDIQAGDEVILPAYTYVSTAHVILQRGATPVFVDIDPSHYGVDLHSLEEAFSPKTKALITVDIAGFPVLYDEISKIIEHKSSFFSPRTGCEAHQLGRVLWISDAAHSFGSEYRGFVSSPSSSPPVADSWEKVGKQADITVFSFHAVKNLTTAEGGAFVWSQTFPYHLKLAEYTKVMTMLGQSKSAREKYMTGSWQYNIVAIGYKMNMPDILAALGNAQLERYEKILTKRKALFQLYREMLSPLQERISLPLLEDDKRKGNAHLFIVQNHSSQPRDFIIEKLYERGISANVHFIPVYKHTAYSDFQHYESKLKNTESIFQRVISLPLSSQLKKKDIYYVVESLQKILF